MTSYETLLARADEETLGKLIGSPATGLLRLLDPKLTRASVLRQVVTNLYEPSTLLRDADARRGLLMLMRPNEAATFVQDLALPGTPTRTTDPYQQIASLNVTAGSKVEHRLHGLLGVRHNPEAVEETSDAEQTFHQRPDYELFPHQRDAVARARVALAQQPHRVLIHMPTGSGKTRVAMNAIVDHLRQHEPSLVVWLAYSEELCEQAVQEFKRAWKVLGNRDLPVHRFWGTYEADIDVARDGMIVAGLAKMYRFGTRSIRALASLADHTSMVVLDEAHMATAETYSLVLSVLSEKDPNTRLLGLTATPGRTWNDIEADEKLAAFFNRKKVTLRIEGYNNPIDYLVDEGYLSRTSFRSLLYDGGYAPSHKDIKRIAESLDMPAHILNQLALHEQRNLVIIRELEELANTHARIILFAATVDHARLIATVLRARGLSAGVITGNTPRQERNHIIERFRSDGGESQILCNFGVLTTGFDAPMVSAAVIARPTKSLVLYSQMVGRAIRGPRMGGTNHCVIVTVVDHNLPGFRSVADSFTNWEDIWEETF